MNDAVEALFIKKTAEAAQIVAANVQTSTVDNSDIPFEVNKVLYKINEETERRRKLFKRKQP
jgi:hypothetical protein